MKGDNCNMFRVGTFTYYEKNLDTAEWRSERMSNRVESRKADIDSLYDIFECNVDFGLSKSNSTLTGTIAGIY